MSNSTRDRIIGAGIKLYNRDGVRNTTIRAIAADLEISPGNLTYYFPAQDVLLEAILEEMTRQRNRRISEVTDLGPQLVLRDYYDLLVDFLIYQQKYRFFYRDILEVFRIVPAAKKSYRARFRERIDQGRNLCLLLAQNGLLIPELRPDHYRILSETISSLSLGRPTRSEALGRDSPQAFALFLLQLYLPYLTKDGLSQLDAIALKSR